VEPGAILLAPPENVAGEDLCVKRHICVACHDMIIAGFPAPYDPEAVTKPELPVVDEELPGVKGDGDIKS
jgi:hypothetical protein